MNRVKFFVIVAIIAAVSTSTYAGTEESLAKIYKDFSNALVVFECKLDNERGTNPIGGQAMCVDDSGIFMTLALNASTIPDSLSEFKIILPGQKDKPIKAKLMGIDPETGIAFIKATEKHTWQVIRFAATPDLSPGKPVYSLGLMAAKYNNKPYIGMGYISSVIQNPGDLVYITGGKLARIGSPVFNANGEAIGIVGGQLYLSYAMIINKRNINAMMQGQQETVFFTPIGEFVHVLKSIPTSPDRVRRLPWPGAFRLEIVTDILAETMSLKTPGIMINDIVPGYAADNAGLKARDVIISVNGKTLKEFPSSELTAKNFVRTINRMKAGDKIELEVMRGTKLFKTSLTLDKTPLHPHEAKRYISRVLGFGSRERVLFDKYMAKEESEDVDGIVVYFAITRLPAAVAGLKRGDVITAVNEQKITTAQQLEEAISESIKNKPSDPIILSVNRNGEQETLRLTPKKP